MCMVLRPYWYLTVIGYHWLMVVDDGGVEMMTIGVMVAVIKSSLTTSY